MSSFEDKEFGTVSVHRSPRSRTVRLSVSAEGALRISMPSYAPIFLAKRLINSSRTSLREMKRSQPERIKFNHGDQVGKSHSLVVHQAANLKVSAKNQLINVSLPPDTLVDDEQVQSAIRDVAVKILRKEAKSYLPRRLAFLADQHGLQYERVRFSYASTRWGSCSSHGTISLNISLMLLPFELIDYVLLHELAHTRHMNHSEAFWDLVHELDSEYKTHRKALKLRSSKL
jgi:predicted metal-dependent hydrolase